MAVLLVTNSLYVGPKRPSGRRYFSIQGELANYNDPNVLWDFALELQVKSSEQIIVTDVLIEHTGSAGVLILHGITNASGGTAVDLPSVMTTVATDWIGVGRLELPIPSNGRYEAVPANYAATDDIAVQISGWIE